MSETMRIAVCPEDGIPYRKDINADKNGSFYHALQREVGGFVESMGYLFNDEPCCYVNEEGKFTCKPNRAIFATKEMADAGYLSQLGDFGRVVEEGELFDITFGPMVFCGFDSETGENRDITDKEFERVLVRFGCNTIGSGYVAAIAVARMAKR